MWRIIVFSAVLELVYCGGVSNLVIVSRENNKRNSVKVLLGKQTKFFRNTDETAIIRTDGDCVSIYLNCDFKITNCECDPCLSTYMQISLEDSTFKINSLKTAKPRIFTLKAKTTFYIRLVADRYSSGGDLDCKAWCGVNTIGGVSHVVQSVIGKILQQ